MSGPPISLEHLHRSSWIARGKDEISRTRLSGQEIPIIRQRGCEDCDLSRGLFCVTLRTSRAADPRNWWMRTGKTLDAWRMALFEGGLVALRPLVVQDDGSEATGAWRGIHRLQTVCIDPSFILLKFDPDPFLETIP